ncbi:hypothetical protein B0T25DRAFT_524779 [Lasiosphaeria hispida]|uniref:DUF3752 domain-containing protein n=1 Tax=Lasiosphaeria hispida TaxID=260671 RepID=A0AAJ0MJB5_9PEZI|nr:hypothetical protein B0T25DRAFT_524779 [Lasiosphaeria hispida]
MASIGPQLPLHLQKRKRTPEDDIEQPTPPTKASRHTNGDEILLDDSDSSDDGFGPSAPSHTVKKPPTSAPKQSIGPSLPPNFTKYQDKKRPPSSPRVAKASPKPSKPIGPARPSVTINRDETPLDESSDTSPAPPPKSIGPTPPPSAAQRRVLGPAPPPADLSQRPTTGPDSGSDAESDSDDGYGPALPSAAESRRAHGPAVPLFARSQPDEPAAPKRDDWMVVPPTSSGYTAPDPTKLKNRKFASGRSAENKPTGGVSSIWTETPEEKARRLANAVLGREDPAMASTAPSGPSKKAHSRRADKSKIKAFTEQTRGRSLVEEHQALRLAGKAVAEGQGGEGKKVIEEEDDPSKRAFDWEKDMKVGGQISGSQRQQLLNKAANFGGRFQTGNYL